MVPCSFSVGWLPVPIQAKSHLCWCRLIRLWNPEETSLEIQNRGTSGPTIGHVFPKNVLIKRVIHKYITLFLPKSHEEAGPSLAQLVECLTDRYSESTSSNPGNLTSATVCGDRTGCVLATKRSASVAPEVDIRERHYFCLRNANKAAHSGFETQRRCHQKSKTGVSVAQKMDMCPPKTLKKRKVMKKRYSKNIFHIDSNFKCMIN